ncbi:pyridoxal phosphate-dependent aminotransferase, partial [Patescibacteria group bacterium]|nr:pyridoxal phosphate-dependent aminotransferase [Patescibacteria group bacterium]
ELGIYINRPEGAFYTMVKLPVDDTEKFAKWLLTDFQDKNETVMVAPGAGFYATKGLGLDEIRVAYVLNEKDLARAAQLLGLAVKRYNSTKK